MKTSELRKVVEENEYKFQKTENFIYISYFGHKRMTLDLQNQAITLDMFLRLGTTCIKKIMVALIEYSLTPISEREDEKKYRIEFGDKLDKRDAKRYLNLNTETNVFFFHFDWLDLMDLESERLLYKGKFTQQEIDDFPQEFKGAIECGFLKKVEVE